MSREELIDEICAQIPDRERVWVADVLDNSPRWVNDWGDVRILGLDDMVFRPEVLEP